MKTVIRMKIVYGIDDLSFGEPEEVSYIDMCKLFEIDRKDIPKSYRIENFNRHGHRAHDKYIYIDPYHIDPSPLHEELESKIKLYVRDKNLKKIC